MSRSASSHGLSESSYHEVFLRKCLCFSGSSHGDDAGRPRAPRGRPRAVEHHRRLRVSFWKTLSRGVERSGSRPFSPVRPRQTGASRRSWMCTQAVHAGGSPIQSACRFSDPGLEAGCRLEPASGFHSAVRTRTHRVRIRVEWTAGIPGAGECITIP